MRSFARERVAVVRDCAVVPGEQVTDYKNAIIAFEDVRFSYGEAHILEGVSFTLKRGGMCVLMGANGAGKSTIVRLLLGELAPNGGSVMIYGQQVGRFRDWKRVGYVPQNSPADYARFPASVFEVVRAGLYAQAGLFRPYGARQRAQTLKTLELVGLLNLAKHQIGELSGGQFQRMLLARALVSGPKVLVLDEPTSNLDDQSTQEFYHAVERERLCEGTAILLVTHDLARLPREIRSDRYVESGCDQESKPDVAGAASSLRTPSASLSIAPWQAYYLRQGRLYPHHDEGW